MRTCFAPLLRWVIRLWKSETKQLALVMDATTLGNRWTILVRSRVVRSCAIPVAWKVLPAEQEGSWRPYWEELLRDLQEAVPPQWQVLVLADRGLYAGWLWDAIRACGWHPFLRLNLGCKARLPGEATFEWISRWVPTPGTSWQGEVECFAGKNSRVKGTLLMHWQAGYESAWVILTDLNPKDALVSWYGLRTWTEGGFKDFKRGLWGWHHSKMQQASHVERLWLAMALAQLWCVSLGCQAEVQQEEQFEQKEPGAALPERHVARKRRKRGAGQLPPRRLSCVVRGKLILIATLFLAPQLPWWPRRRRRRRRSGVNGKNVVYASVRVRPPKKPILVRGRRVSPGQPPAPQGKREAPSHLPRRPLPLPSPKKPTSESSLTLTRLDHL